MSIICEHVHRLELRKLSCCGNATSLPKTRFISYSCISYFGHACLKLNLVLFTFLIGKCATQKYKKNLRNSCLWTYYGRIKEPKYELLF